MTEGGVVEGGLVTEGGLGVEGGLVTEGMGVGWRVAW